MIPCQRHLFDLPDDVAYLNCAYMSPLLRASIEAGERAIARKARPWSIRPVDFFTDSERLRALLARLIGASADDVAIVPSASYGLAVAARNLALGRRRRILVLEDQFPSNVYVWLDKAREAEGEVLTVAIPEDGDMTRAVLDGLDERVAIAALPHCRWTDGALLDLEAIGARCKDLGCALVLDVTQSLGALPLDVAAVRPDFVACAAYKWLLGPYGLAFLYVGPENQDGRPLEHNWIARKGSEDFAALVDYQADFQPGARRFDMGERSSFVLVPMAIVAIEQLLAWRVPEIQRTLADMTAGIAEEAEALGLSSPPPGLRAGHFLGLRFPGPAPRDLPERLADERVHVSLRGDSLRITPHLYNHEADIERLLTVLRAVL